MDAHSTEIEMDVLSTTPQTGSSNGSPSPVEMDRDDVSSSGRSVGGGLSKKEQKYSWKSYTRCLCFTCPRGYGKNQHWWWGFCWCCCACYFCFCFEFLFNTLLRALRLPPLCCCVERLFCCWNDCSSCQRCCNHPGVQTCLGGCLVVAECLGCCCKLLGACAGALG